MTHRLQLKKPLAFFDLETTGLSIISDKIIEIAVLKALPNGTTETYHKRVNPEIPIHPIASQVHGIKNEDLLNEPTFKQIGREVEKFLEGADLAGFNILKFDVPMLVEEFLRAGIDFDISKRLLVDAQKVFHLMEPRTLTAAYKFYLNKPIETLGSAHSAMVDIQATFEVLQEQIDKYEGQKVKLREDVEPVEITRDMNSLHQLSFDRMFDLAGRMVFNLKGDLVFNFGKYKDHLVADVLKRDQSYYDWVMKGDFTQDTKRKLTQVKLGLLNA